MAEKLSIQVPIKDSVLEQLKHRRNLLIRTEEAPLDASELMHNNNKGAWIVLASSANSGTSNKLARENVLTGGTGFYTVDGESKEYKFNIKEGFSPDGNIRSSYTQNSQIGFRPMMGITDLTVASKTTYGALRQVEIGIKAWSQEQLSILETIYLRPGFTMFVEFGNAVYIDEGGDLTSKNESLHLEFLKGTPISKIKKEIKKRRERSGFNYDGMIGKVQNFSWSFAKDGSYDCSLQLISQGELVESLSIVKYDKKQEIPETVKESGVDIPNDLLLGMLNVLKAAKNGDTVDQFEKTFGLEDGDGVLYYSYTPNIKDNSEEQDDPENVQVAASRFIPVYSLLHILNTKFIKPVLNDKSKTPIFLFNEDPTISKYNYFHSNISNDPFICSVPYNDGDKGKCLYSQKELYGGTPPRESVQATKFEKKKWGDEFRFDSPYFIIVNVQCLIDIQKSFIAQKKQNADLVVSVFTYMKKVLELINSALGGICHLDLTKDEDTDTWIIIDRNCNESIPAKKAIPTLDLVGLGSLVEDIKLESKLSNSLASSIAIAASAVGDNEAQESFFKLNNGVNDRYTEANVDDETKKGYKQEKLEEDKKAIEENQKNIATAYKKYTVDKNFTQGNFDAISSDHSNYMSFERTNEKVRKSKTGKQRTFDGLIPFDLSLTLDGIGGLRPTDCFTIGKNVLPDRYIGKVGFIITNVDHSIGNDNRWVTEVTSKMFMLPDNQPVDTELILEDVETFIPPAIDESTIQQNVKAVYGEPGVFSNLEKVTVPEGFNLTYGGAKQDYIYIHKDVKDNLRNAMQETLDHYGKEGLKDYRINIYNGAYNNRNKRGGVTKSLHAWGIALDFDASNNKLRWGKDKASFAKPEYIKFLEIFKKYGFYNLGTEKNYDYMHFQAWDPNQKE